MNGQGCCGSPLNGLGATFYSRGQQVPQSAYPRPPWPERPGVLSYNGYGAAAAHTYPAWTNAGLFERVGMSPDHAVVASYVVTAAGVGAASFHGYRRNQSVGWALGWAVSSFLFPFLTTGIALAQGFGKPAGK